MADQFKQILSPHATKSCCFLLPEDTDRNSLEKQGLFIAGMVLTVIESEERYE